MNDLDYEVQVSPRAHHPRLRMSARDGLVVVVPEGFDQTRIPAIMDRRRDWIRRNERRLAEQRKFLVPTPPGGPPERILLRVIGEEWGVDYRQTDAATVTTVERLGKRLLVYGSIERDNAVIDALRRWLSRKARQHLVPWLARLASEHGFDVSSIAVRSQRTRWASCSSRKTISINTRLLFLPEPLVRYAMLHELAHTVEMNHGPRFWATMQSMDPLYKVNDAELRAAWRLVPDWMKLGSDAKPEASPLTFPTPTGRAGEARAAQITGSH